MNAMQPPQSVEEIKAGLETTEKGGVRQSIRNCLTVFQRDPLLSGAIAYNILTDRKDIIKPIGFHRESTALTDTDMKYLLLYLEETYGLTSEKKIETAIGIVANENKYHPIRDFLNSLAWDGTERIRFCLRHFLGADVDDYTYEALKLFMLGAITRAFKPGSKFEIMLCLVGGQGAGKSTFFRLLAVRDEWFSDDLRKLDDDNVYRKLQGHWIIEMSEIACYELIEMITQHNNMAQFEPALIMRWIFKTAISVWLISNTFDIVMAVFDITQKVVSDSSGIIAGNTRVNDIGLSMLQSSLMQMDVGPLFGLFLQSFFIGITMRILSIIIFVIVYGRMIEIYCMVSLAPIPMATFGNHEQSHMGQNYLKCLFALGFQGFLILICVAIYAVLIQSVAISGDAINSIWSIVGYTVLLCFSLFKTSSVTKSVLGAH